MTLAAALGILDVWLFKRTERRADLESLALVVHCIAGLGAFALLYAISIHNPNI